MHYGSWQKCHDPVKRLVFIHVSLYIYILGATVTVHIKFWSLCFIVVWSNFPSFFAVLKEIGTVITDNLNQEPVKFTWHLHLFLFWIHLTWFNHLDLHVCNYSRFIKCKLRYTPWHRHRDFVDVTVTVRDNNKNFFEKFNVIFWW